MPMFAVRILLFFQIVLAAVPMSIRHELAHLPALAAHFHGHFQEHQAENADFSLADFWSLHFGSKAVAHAAESEHSDVPCQSHNHSCASLFSPILNENAPVFEPFLMKSLPKEPSRSACFLEKTMRSSSHLMGIWQPPKTMV